MLAQQTEGVVKAAYVYLEGVVDTEQMVTSLSSQLVSMQPPCVFPI